MYLLIIFYNIRYYTYLVSAVIEKKPTTEVFLLYGACELVVSEGGRKE
jgi:hypothetical protein